MKRALPSDSQQPGAPSLAANAALTSTDLLKLHKRRKPTTRSLPLSLLRDGDPALRETAEAFDSLLEKEKELDWRLARRRAELADASTAGGNAGGKTVWRTLRIRVGNTCEGQEWQKKGQKQEDQEDQKIDWETGEGVPKWTCTIEGQLLDVSRSREAPAARRRRVGSQQHWDEVQEPD